MDSPKKTVISIDVSDKEISEMRYERDKKRLNICLFLKKGMIQEKDIALLNCEAITASEASG